jgi:hypothetical protein
MKRLWGIRHIRYYYLAWQCDRWWRDTGRWYWLIPNERDIAFLEDVWQGKA